MKESQSYYCVVMEILKGYTLQLLQDKMHAVLKEKPELWVVMIKYLLNCEIFFEVNRERLVYNLESQQAATLGRISYWKIAGVQTVYSWYQNRKWPGNGGRSIKIELRARNRVSLHNYKYSSQRSFNKIRVWRCLDLRSILLLIVRLPAYS
jgi:hypothetical protein